MRERTNVRHLDPDDLGGAVDLTVADLSFISLVTVAPALVRCTTPDGDLVLLVKPQFEAGRARIGKGGVVRDPRGAPGGARTRCVTVCATPGSTSSTSMVSPLKGADGNVEFLARCDARGPALDDDRLDDAVPA